VVNLQSCVFDGGQNVIAVEERIIGKNFFKGGTGAEQLQNVHHSHALAAIAGTAATFIALDGDPLEEFRVHIVDSNILPWSTAK